MSNKDIKDYYYILGLNKNASKDEIKTAYRKLSLKFHPDQNSGDKFFEERFKDLHEAYETLVDDEKRRIYDYILRENSYSTEKNYSNTTTSQKAPPPGSSPSKKSSKQIVFTIIGILLFLSPFILGAVKRILEKRKSSETYNLLRYDTTHNRVIDSPGSLITIPDTASLTSTISSQTAGSGSLNTTSSDDSKQTPNFKDDDGLTAQGAVSYFLNALNNSDCNSAWNMMYNTSWVNLGKDWFCSNQAFGTVKKVLVRNIYTMSQYETAAEIYADYYAEDSYNGNKCFKQKITAQKILYTDNKSRWKVTMMTNTETPVDCTGN